MKIPSSIYTLNDQSKEYIETMDLYEFMYHSLPPKYANNLLFRTVINDIALNLIQIERPLIDEHEKLKNPLTFLLVDTVLMFQMVFRLKVYTIDSVERSLFASVILVKRLLEVFDEVFLEQDYDTRKLLWDSFCMDMGYLFDEKFENLQLYPKDLLVAQTMVGKKLRKRIIEDYTNFQHHLLGDVKFLEEAFFIEKKLMI